MTADKRILQRRRVLRTGKILFAHGASVLDCTIKNVSEHGAMLQVEHSVSVPDQFQLYEPSRMLLHEVRVIRRDKQLIGIAITGTRDIAESVDPRIRRLKLMQ